MQSSEAPTETLIIMGPEAARMAPKTRLPVPKRDWEPCYRCIVAANLPLVGCLTASGFSLE